MDKASTHKDCNGCRHQFDHDGGWCYMFVQRPVIIPCGQHDMYKEQRQANGMRMLAHMQTMHDLVNLEDND